jgi:hypothetical protein
MIRIYLDWNVFSGLKKNECEENDTPHSLLQKKIKSLDGKVLIPYSATHLQDLSKGFGSSEQNNKYVYEDLEFLSSLTKNLCLSTKLNEKGVYPSVICPKDYFKEIIENSRNDPFESFDKLFDTSLFDEGSKEGELINSMKTIYKVMPHGLDFSKLDEQAKEYDLSPLNFNDWFPNARKENSLNALINDVLELVDKVNKDPKLWKGLRKMTQNLLELNPSIVSTFKDVFGQLDKKLEVSPLKIGFHDFVKTNIESNEYSKKDPRFSYFTSYYHSLDLFGFRPEKLSKKNTFENFNNDAMHSYYAAHCDVFVSDDKRTRAKASTIYEKFGIETKVFSVEEFIAQIDNHIHYFEKPENSLIEQLLKILEFDETQDIEIENLENIKYSYIIFTKVKYLNFFNVMYFIEYTNGDLGYFFKVTPDNYSTFFFWEEIEIMIFHLTSMLGSDLQGFNKFEESEKSEIIDGKWKGRIWRINKGLFRLIRDKNGFMFTFEILKELIGETD